MTPTLLHTALTQAGFHLRTDGAALLVNPASRLTAEQRAAVVAHKPELWRRVREQEDEMVLNYILQFGLHRCKPVSRRSLRGLD